MRANANEELEALAKQFRAETGLLAPFKDAPAAVGNDPAYNQKHRQEEWDKWFHSKYGGSS